MTRAHTEAAAVEAGYTRGEILTRLEYLAEAEACHDRALALLRPLGLRLPMVAVHGWSVTAPLRLLEGHPDLGPRSGVMDERYKVAISRLGLRVRVAGGAELGGRLATPPADALRTLYKVLDDWFPGSTQNAQAQAWKGARPMLPDGPPVIGASGAEGVWLNLGHGSSGWALSCGSARLLADLVGGQVPLGLDDVQVMTPFHEANKIRLLAVASEQRSDKLPVPDQVQEAIRTLLRWAGDDVQL